MKKTALFGLMGKILERTRQRPKIISDEELSNLQKPSRRKITLRFIFFFLGLTIIALGVLFLYFSWTVDWFVWKAEYKDREIDINLSFIFGMIIIAIGSWVLSRLQLNKNLLRENTTYFPYLSKRREPLCHQVEGEYDPRDFRDFVKIRSFPSTRLIASMLMIFTAAWNISTFGVEFTSESHIGNWFALGGPSMFYPMSLLPLLYAIGLMLYIIGSSAVITFTKSPHFIFIEEYRFLAPWMTEIPRDKIVGVRLTNAKTGAKYLWVFALMFHIVWCMTDGLHFLLNPFAYGAGIVVGIHYVVTAFIQIIVMFLLVFRTQTFLEIITEEKRYELQFSPPAAMPNVRGMIEELFGFPPLNEKNTKFQRYPLPDDSIDIVERDLKKSLIIDWRNLSVGLVFWIIAFSSKILQVYAGDALRIFLWNFGFILIVKGIKNDFSSPRNKLTMKWSPSERVLFWRHEWMWFNSVYRINKIDEEQFKFDIRLEKLSFFDVLLGLILPILLGIDLYSVWYFVPSTEQLGQDIMFWWRFQGLHLIMDILLLGLIALVLLRPNNSLLIKHPRLKYEYHLPGTQSKEQANTLKRNNAIGRWLCRWQTSFKNQFSTFIIRIIVIIIMFGLGILISASTVGTI